MGAFWEASLFVFTGLKLFKQYFDYMYIVYITDHLHRQRSRGHNKDWPVRGR